MTALLPLRPHQERAIDGVKASFRAGKRRPVISLPTGAGKTLIATHIIHGALTKGKRINFAVPMLNLVDQSFQRFMQNAVDPADIGVVQGDHDWRRPQARVQIVSVQTAARRGWPDADLIIVDECHLQFDAVNKYIADNPGKLFVGLSATPYSKGLGDHWDDLIIPTSIAELIEQGYLSKFRVFAPSHPDLSGVKIIGGDYHEGQLSERMSGAKIVADVVGTWLDKGDDQPTLCFAVDRGHAQALHDQFASVGVTSAYVDANTEREERKRIIDQFQAGEVKVICSIGTMTTGVDVDCRCIIMARPTKSEILFVQCIGRGLRTAPGKEVATILDHSDNHLRLGMVTDIHHDTLRTSKGDAERKEKREVERETPKPFECPKCTRLIPYKSLTCEGCGWVSRRPNKVTVQAGELRELGASGPRLKREPAIARLAREGEQAIYSQLLGMQGTKKDGWVGFKFEKIFGHKRTRNLLREASEPSSALRSWVRAENIAWARSRDNQSEGYANAAE